MAEADEQLLTVLEAAGRARVNPETIRRWIKSGRLPAAKPAGGPYRIHSTDLERLLGAQELPKLVPKAGASPSPAEPADEERRAGESLEKSLEEGWLTSLAPFVKRIDAETKHWQELVDSGKVSLDRVEDATFYRTLATQQFKDMVDAAVKAHWGEAELDFLARVYQKVSGPHEEAWKSLLKTLVDIYGTSEFLTKIRRRGEEAQRVVEDEGKRLGAS